MKTTKKKLLILLTLAFLPAALFLLPAFAAAPSIPPARPASQAETDAGAISNKFVSPATLAGYSLAQSTGSISAATATNIANYAALIATNKLNTDIPVRLNYPLTNNDVRNVSFASSNLTVGVGASNWVGTAGDVLTLSANGTGFYFDNQTDIIYLLETSTFPGNNVQTGSLNSNRLDAATLALLGTGSGTTYTNNPTTSLAAGKITGDSIGTNIAWAYLTGVPAGFADGTDDGAASGLLTVDTNALLYTTNVNARYDTNTIRISTGLQSNPDAWLDTIGSAGSVTPHFSVGGATAWWDFNLPVTNADVVHFSSVVVIDPDNMVYGAGTLALPATTLSGLATLNASATIGNGATTAGVLKLLEDTDDGSNFASFQVPALAANTVYTLPTTDGAASEFLQTDGSGTLTWATPSGSTAYWFTNPVAATSISNAYNVKIAGNLDVTGTNTSGTANITNMYLVGRASALALIESDGQLETNAVGTAVPINADGTQTSFANLQTGTARTITTNNATLTSGRVQVGDGGRGVANATASGAVPIDADGTATTFAQIQALAPSVIQTNGASTSYSNNASITAPAYYSPTNANNTGAYTAGLSYFTNLTGNITLAPFASIPSGSWSITIAAKADGTTRSITFPNGTVNNAVNTAPAVAYVTNGTTLVLQVTGYGSSFTNVLTPH